MWVLPCGVYRQEIREYWSPVGCRDCGIRALISQMASLCSQRLNESLRTHCKRDQGQQDHSPGHPSNQGQWVPCLWGLFSYPSSLLVFLSSSEFGFLSICPSLCPSIHPFVHLSIYSFISLSIHLPIHPSAHPPIYLSTQPASQPGSRSALTVNALKPGLSLTVCFPGCCKHSV